MTKSTLSIKNNEEIEQKVRLPFTGIFSRIREALRPRPEDLVRSCPHCGQEFEEIRRYCMACGGQIWDDVLPEHLK